MEFALQVFQFILLSSVVYGRSLDLDVQSLMNVTPWSTQPKFWSQLRVKFECHRGFSSKCCLLSLIIFYFALPLIGSQKPLYHLNQSDTKQSYIVSFFSSSFFVRWEGRKQTSSHQQIHACCHCFRASARYGRAIVIVYIWKRKSFLLI